MDQEWKVCDFWSGFLQAQACAMVLAVRSCSSLPPCSIFSLISRMKHIWQIKKGL